MAKYTITLLELAEDLTNSEYVASKGSELIASLSAYLFDFDYPMYNPMHKAEFQEKFIRHYLMREIGQETPALFKLFLQSRLLDIMPYYNILYEINDLLSQIDILNDRDLTTETHRHDKTDEDRILNGDNQYYGTDTESGKDQRDIEDRNNVLEISRDTGDLEHTKNENTKNDTTRTNDLKSTQTSNDKVTHDGTLDERTYGQADTIEQGNQANSDFPQANVYAATNQYYSTGQENHGEKQNNTDETRTSTTGSVDTSNWDRTNTDTGTVTDNATGTIVASNMEIRNLENMKNDTANSDKREFYNTNYNTNTNRSEVLRRVDGLLRQINGKGKKREYGRTGRKSVAELLAEYRDTYANVDYLIIRECRDLFMLIY